MNPHEAGKKNGHMNGMSWERQIPPKNDNQGVLKSSVTSKFNNDLIHSEKDSNGKALVQNF